MRGLVGLLWAIGGAVAGLIIGIIGASAYAAATDMTTREGARGYFVIAIGIICAILGLIAGLVFYGRSAPSGQGAAYTGSGTIGFVALVAAIALGLWAFMKLRETPLMYGNAQANLLMEFRVKSSELPDSGSLHSWLNVEVQTTKTRPVGLLLLDQKRVEGEFTILPVVQSSLYRSGNRMIVARIGDQQTEVFQPPMKRTPDPKADWSEWYRPRIVDPPYGVTPPAPLKSKLEMRYKIEVWGQ